MQIARSSYYQAANERVQDMQVPSSSLAGAVVVTSASLKLLREKAVQLDRGESLHAFRFSSLRRQFYDDFSIISRRST